MNEKEKNSAQLLAELEALRASEKNLSAVFDGLQDGVFIHSMDGTILDVNVKALQLFRMSKEQVIGRNIARDFFRPHNPLEKLSDIRSKLLIGETIGFQWVAKRAGEKSLFPVEILVRMIQRDSRDVVLTTVRDITRHKKKKIQLQQRRRQLALILDGNPIPTFVIDKNHHVILWNKACENLTGVSKTQVLSKPLDSRIFYPGQIRPVLANLVLEMDRQRIQELYKDKNIKASGFIPEAYEASDRLRIQGKVRDVYFLAARCRDADGEVIAAIETIQDISDRIRAEEALKANRKLLAEVTANIPGLVYQYSFSSLGNGRFTFISNGLRTMFQLSPRQVMRKPELFFLRLDAQVREQFQTFLQMPAPSGRLVEFEFSVESGATHKWYKNSALADVRSKGEILWNGMLTDITEMKRLESMKSDVEQMVRHDLKSPLMGIGGLSKLLLNEELSPRQREFVDAIYHSSIKLLHMINHSMALLKMEENSYILHPEEFDLVEMFRSLHEEFLPSADGKLLKFIHLLDGLPLSWEDTRHVQGERLLLESLFANLIQNAVEAAPEGSRITISIRSREHVHEVDIHNFGAIPESIRHNFFERYVTSGKKYGTGIGTYSAMLIAKTHQGDIRFTTSEQEGTHLIVTLPRSFAELD
ncbi:MAG TPA: PAS domain S-box protein [Desulfonatronum sp.]|nr:PAS domain S-box protein [Desulfonatronum sp.]